MHPDLIWLESTGSKQVFILFRECRIGTMEWCHSQVCKLRLMSEHLCVINFHVLMPGCLAALLIFFYWVSSIYFKLHEKLGYQIFKSLKLPGSSKYIACTFSFTSSIFNFTSSFKCSSLCCCCIALICKSLHFTHALIDQLDEWVTIIVMPFSEVISRTVLPDWVSQSGCPFLSWINIQCSSLILCLVI